MSSGKVFLGLLAGVAAGALLGVLFAPDKGSVTRKKMTKKGEDYAESLKEMFNEFLESITDKFEHVKEDVSDFTEKSKSKTEKAERDFKNAAV
jgi:gas vesicle protein